MHRISHVPPEIYAMARALGRRKIKMPLVVSTRRRVNHIGGPSQYQVVHYRVKRAGDRSRGETEGF